MRRGLLLVALLGCKGSDDDDVPPCTLELGTVWYADRDGDQQGDPDAFLIQCEGPAPSAHVLNADDCDDRDPATFALAPEICDGADNDCDGDTDEGLPFYQWYADADGDEWGSGPGVSACGAPDGHVRESGDCDDGRPTVYPTANEICDGIDNDCDGLPDDADDDLTAFGANVFHPDADGDGFGDRFSLVIGCDQPPGTLVDGEDCDDADAAVFPGALEVCDEVDNDCDGLNDTFDSDLDVSTLQMFYFDSDQDGFGDPDLGVLNCSPFGFYVEDGTDCDDSRPEVMGPSTTAWLEDLDDDGVGAGPPALTGCIPPTPEWVGTWVGVDCDDTEPTVNPLAAEVCDGLDNNCIDGIDEEDPALEASSAQLYFLDGDFDGFGGPGQLLCTDPGGGVGVGGDCDDADPLVNPGALEVCNGGIDDNCNGFADDFDSALDPSSSGFYFDGDGDGYGDATQPLVACSEGPSRVDNPDDCDDSDPNIVASTFWWLDSDGDGYGTGPTQGPSCESPLINGAPVDRGEDCDDARGFVFPGASDLCGDGIDQDCDGLDRPCPRPDCATILADGLSTGDGVYAIDPTGFGSRDVWCDMTTDGGGWTLVSSSAFPVNDQADVYSSGLASLEPQTLMIGVWDGLRSQIPGNSDIRFACKRLPLVDAFDVDLVIYDIHWYRELTTSVFEGDVCFNEDDGLGYDAPAPERLNVLTGQVRELGNDWDDGYLEGEDLCDSPDDFTIDFDDRGMDSNQFDGTEWGLDDDLVKCGVTNVGSSWFIFVR